LTSVLLFIEVAGNPVVCNLCVNFKGVWGKQKF